jgi:hypothetical protein
MPKIQNIQTKDETDKITILAKLYDRVPAGMIKGLSVFVELQTGIKPSRLEKIKSLSIGDPRMIRVDEAFLLAHVFDVKIEEFMNIDIMLLVEGVKKVKDVHHSEYVEYTDPKKIGSQD